MKDNHILGRYTAPAGEVEQGLGEKLLEALTVGRDAVMETFDYISDRADQDLAEMRLRSIDDALNSFSWPHTPAAPVQGEERTIESVIRMELEDLASNFEGAGHSQWTNQEIADAIRERIKNHHFYALEPFPAESGA